MERPIPAVDQRDSSPDSAEPAAPAVRPDALSELFGQAFLHEHADAYRAGVRDAVNALTDQTAPDGDAP